MLREGRFPGSIPSNEGHTLPRMQPEMNPTKNRAIIVMKPEIFGFNHRMEG
jgi:hypothetical protein